MTTDGSRPRDGSTDGSRTDGAVPPGTDGGVPPDTDGGVPPDMDGGTPPDMDGGTPPDVDGGPLGFDAGGLPDGSPFMVDDAGHVLCGTHVCQCADGIDNDMDGTADGFDFECTGPYDDDEGTFGTGIPGDNRDPFCQDCFFDGNSGSGDDMCRYDSECLATGTPSGHGSCGRSCDVSDACRMNCQVLAPNGCDCFGCCEVHTATATVNIVIGGTCSIETISDTTACPRCVPTPSCINTCERCELCLGRTIADLPADCFPPPPPTDGGTPPADGGTPPADGGPRTDGGTPPADGGPRTDGGTPPVDAGSDAGVPYRCPTGEPTCTPTLACPTGLYCLQGCCIIIF